MPPEHLTRGYCTPDPRSVLCPQLNLLNPPPKKFLGTPLDLGSETPNRSVCNSVERL